MEDRETKWCNKCKQDLNISEFSKNSSRYDKLQPYCIGCMKEYRREHYNKDKDSYKRRARNKTKFLVEFINRVRRLSSCIKCDETRWWVLDFHHRDPKHKEKTVSELARLGSMKNLKTEIRKCDIVCANCHRDIHYQQQAGSHRRGNRSPKP